MRRAFGVFLGLAIGFLFLGLDISREASGDHSNWRVSLASPAHAQIGSGGCEVGGDDPDGDGDECDPTYTQNVNPPKNLGDPCGNGCGDPINFATGSLYDAQTDYASVGPFPLVLIRYYNSQDPGLHKFGANWRGPYGRSLTRTSSTVFTATRDDGRVFTFTLTSGVWKVEADVNFRLTAAGSGWSLVTDQDETETYDVNLRLVTFANRAGLTQTFSRDAQGRLVAVTDPFGRTMTFVTSPNGQVTQVTAPDGGVYSYSYDASSRLTAVTFPDSSRRQYVYENATFPTNLTGIIDENGNRYATFAYDASGRAISTQQAGGAERNTVDYSQLVSIGAVNVTGPLGGVTSYALTAIDGTAKHQTVFRSCSNCFFVGNYLDNGYDANGNLTAHLDFNFNETTYTYDTTRNLETSRTMAFGTSIARTITTTWHPTYRLPTLIVDGGRSVTNSYDAKGNLLSSTLTAPTLTSTRRFTYNSSGQVLTATDPLGHVTTYAYDARGNLTSVTNALGQATLFTSYDANGRPLSIQDANGVATTQTYNFRGQITSKITLLRMTTYAYDAVGNLTKVTQPDGSFLTMTYDAAHRLIGIADALGNTIAYTLDAAGNRIRTQVFDPSHTLRRTHSQVFDGFSRLYQDVGALSQTSTFYNDDNDNVNFIYNPLNIQTQNFFDALNRVSQTDKNGSSTLFGYDTKNRLNLMIDPRNLATSYTYDGLGDLTSIASPDAGTTTKTYDAAGNLTTSRDASGHTTTYTYDALNRVIKKTLSDGTAISFQYDQGTNGIGRLTAMIDPSGTTTWAYNRYGQVNLRQQTIGTVTLTTRWGYTSATGLVSSITYPSGSAVFLFYDADGQVNAITSQPSGGAASALLSQIVYQPFGPVASWHNANGTTYSRTYDLDGRIAGLALPAGDNIALTYDVASRITNMTETGLAAKTFAYDALDRLTNYTAGSLTQTFAYDAVGNRTSYATNSPSSLSYAYQYAATSNRLINVSGSGSETYAYDAAGNVTTHQTPGGTSSFAYNARNRQSQVTVGTSVKNYQIDGLGQRVARLDVSAYQTLFSYDAAGHVMGYYSSGGSPIYETVWLGDLPVAVLAPGAQYFVAPDHLGAPHQITTAAGAVVWFWDHDPFGNGTPTGSLISYNLRFPGQIYDQQSGLYYNYYRDYDPTKGRYVESDPIGLGGGVSTYGYAEGNPSSNADAFGLYVGADDAAAAGTGAVLGVLVQAGSDLVSWRLSSWQSYVGAAAGGAAGGEAFLYTGPIGAGLAGAAVRNATTQGLNIATDPCAKFNLLSLAEDTAIGGLLGVGGQLLGRATGPLKQWIRIGPSYSKSLDEPITMSIRWGASPANGGKYLNEIGSETLQDINQWLRAQQVPFSGWRGADPGHFHLW